MALVSSCSNDGRLEMKPLEKRMRRLEMIGRIQLCSLFLLVLAGASAQVPSTALLEKKAIEGLSGYGAAASTKQAFGILQAQELQIINSAGGIAAIVGADASGQGVVTVLNSRGDFVAVMAVDDNQNGGYVSLNGSGNRIGFLGAESAGNGALNIHNSSGQLVNVVGTDHSMKLANEHGVKKYFAVSSDKANNPANLMGSTKCIMEDILFTNPYGATCSTARFANVAFSDGSLLHGFRQRLLKNQPISAPADIRRYFIIPEEAGELCLMSTIFGEHKDIFFPKENNEELKLTDFPGIARAYLESMGYEAVEVDSEEEARAQVSELAAIRKWPCYFFTSDTSGEKPFEEFFTDDDIVNWDRFNDIGIVKWQGEGSNPFERAQEFLSEYSRLRQSNNWQRNDVVKMIKKACPTLRYVDTGKFLSGRM